MLDYSALIRDAKLNIITIVTTDVEMEEQRDRSIWDNHRKISWGEYVMNKVTPRIAMNEMYA